MTEQDKLNVKLWQAARDGRIADVEKALGQGADINYADVWGKTVLIKAIMEQHADVALLLIGKSPDLNLCDKGGQSALMWACESSPLPEVAEALIAKGADLDIVNDNDRWTALMKAAYYNNPGHAEIARMLIEAGADTEIKNGDDLTPLEMADMRGHENMADILRQAERLRQDFLDRLAEAKEKASDAAGHVTAAENQEKLKAHAPKIRLGGLSCR